VPRSQVSLAFPGRAHDLLSYAGALVAYLSAAHFESHQCLPVVSWASVGTLGCLLWCCHFFKRIFECSWVHRYAGRRVPLADALYEYVYYWGFGIWNAVALSSKATIPIDAVGMAAIVVFLVAESGNGWAHLKLRALRRPNTNERNIPRGGLFNWVSSANYTFELLAWAGFCLLARTLASVVFLLAIALVLGSWAKKRHQRYLELFDGKDGRPLYPAGRRALIPGLF